MSRIRVYTVHVNPAQANAYEAAEFVEEGFNWKAFLFGALWALYHRLWQPALYVVVVNMLIAQLLTGGMITHTGGVVLQLGVQMLVGFYANDWRRARLQRRNYLTADIVAGDSLLRAEQRFFERYFPLTSSGQAGSLVL